MNERGTECLGQYDLNVISTRRTRGAVLCETNQGLKLLKECSVSANRIQFEDEVLGSFARTENLKVDSYVRTRDGNLIADEPDVGRYILKNWYEGKECDVKEPDEVLLGVRALAILHKTLRTIKPSECFCQNSVKPISLCQEFDRHNREMRRARSYIRQVRNKSDFELAVMRTFPLFYEQAEMGLKLLCGLGKTENYYLCHGNYTHHHILVGARQVAITEFTKMRLGIQAWDFYHFMRKVMEKHNWNLKLAASMLEAYQSVLPLEPWELKYFYVLFLYPEKYWKQLNFYYNTNKAWIPERNLEKLKRLEQQYGLRKDFVDWLGRKCSILS